MEDCNSRGLVLVPLWRCWRHWVTLSWKSRARINSLRWTRGRDVTQIVWRHRGRRSRWSRHGRYGSHVAAYVVSGFINTAAGR